MIASLLLMAFAWLVVVVAVRTLPDAAWTRRAPRLGVIAWQTVSLAVPISLILAGTVLALPVFTTASGDLAGLLGACEFMLRQHYETPGGRSSTSLALPSPWCSSSGPGGFSQHTCGWSVANGGSSGAASRWWVRRRPRTAFGWSTMTAPLSSAFLVDGPTS